MLIVTGFGRSGTSFMMHFFKNCGFRVPGVWLPQVDAGWEIPSEITEDMKLEILDGKKRERWRTYIRMCNYKVVKRPYLANFGGKLLEMWHSIRQDFSVLFLIRRPEDVIASRLRHGKHFLARRRENIPLFYEDLCKCLLVMDRLGIRYKVHSFPYFLDKPVEMFDSLEYLGVEINRRHARGVWDKLVDKKLVHIKEE